jgi:NAD(P)-dependent dehydrogenase (short-subunit alcohol dehydrogenase family)
MRLNEKKVLLTGANGGLGLAMARLFSREGADVALVDREVGRCEALAREAEGWGRRPLVIAADLSVIDGLGALVERVAAHYGRIDVLVNNAGIVERLELDELTPAMWERTLTLNLEAFLFLVQAVVPHMQRHGDGRIVCIGSRASRDGGVAVGLSYAVSKAGLELLVKRLARDLGPQGIRVNLVRPGPVDTPMLGDLSAAEREALARSIPLGRLCRPEEVARTALFLASDESSFVSGAVVDVTGGQ